MLITENGNCFFDVELVFKHNRTRLKLERNSNIATRNDMLKLLSNRRKRKLPLIFDYYLVGFNDRTIEDEAEVAVREENKFKKMPTSLGFEDRLVSDI